MERRILRQRQRDLATRLDQLSRAPAGSGPMAVQIVDLGAIPTSTDHYFACVPVTPGGTEAENNAPTLGADSGIVYVLVVGSKVPVAGAYLIARAIGGRWVAESGSPASCLWTFHPAGCSGAAMSGALITLKQAGVTIASCTSSGGSCQVDVPVGSYDITATPPAGSGYATYSASGVAHTCNQTSTISLTLAAGYICGSCVPCSSIPLPTTLHIVGNWAGAPVSDTLIYDSVATSWIGQNPQTDSNGATYWLMIQCTTALTLFKGPTQGTKDASIYGWSAGTGDTCTPLNLTNSPNENYPFIYFTLTG